MDTPNRAWFDESNALHELALKVSAAGDDPELSRVGQSLILSGFAVLPGLAPHALCDSVCADFDRFVAEHAEYAARHTDASGRHLRFVNLHMISDAAMRIGNMELLMRVLDLYFGRRAGIYTSLFFEYGTQQPIHRDAPFFHTYPKNLFVGAWIALEDIHVDAGPLMYIPGGHRWIIDERALFEETRRANPEQDENWVLRQTLELYYGEVIARSANFGEPVRVLAKKGDCLIWHGSLPHGGAPANDPRLTRKSIVFHCAPVDLQVYQHHAFFTADEPPPPRYGFKSYGGRQYAIAGEPAFQVKE